MITRYKHAYVLNVMSDDHPGIVAAVTGAVEALEGNIDACSQTVPRAYFTLIMIASVPQEISAEELAVRIIPVPGAKAGDVVDFGGLFGSTPVAEVRNSGVSERFVRFGGRIPAPLQSLGN